MKALADAGMIPPIQVPVNPPIDNDVPKRFWDLGNDAFFHLLLGSMMIGNDNDMLTMSLNLKT